MNYSMHIIGSKRMRNFLQVDFLHFKSKDPVLIQKDQPYIGQGSKMLKCSRFPHFTDVDLTNTKWHYFHDLLWKGHR